MISISQGDTIDTSFESNIDRCLVLCDVLAAADIHNVSPYIACKYGEKFNTAWKDNPDLIKKFFRNHKKELYSYNAFMLNQIVNHLVSMIRCINYRPTISVDAATANCLDNLIKELSNDADVVELQQVLTTNLEDTLENRNTFMRNPIFSKFELLNQIVLTNLEIDKDIRIYKNGADRKGPYVFAKLLEDACVKVLKNINARMGQLPVFHAWGTVLGAIYKLHVNDGWLYINGHGRYYREPTRHELEPYCHMRLEDVLVDPTENVEVVPDERLFKIMQCDRCAMQPNHDLVKRYVNLFYHVKNGCCDRLACD